MCSGGVPPYRELPSDKTKAVFTIRSAMFFISPFVASAFLTVLLVTTRSRTTTAYSTDIKISMKPKNNALSLLGVFHHFHPAKSAATARGDQKIQKCKFFIFTLSANLVSAKVTGHLFQFTFAYAK